MKSRKDSRAPPSSPSNRWDILIVDDDEEFRSHLSELLQVAGYSVRQAADGIAGLEEIEREMPSLVLLVLNVSGLNGFNLLKALRARPLSAQVPVAVISKFGFAWEASLVEADGCIDKPLRPENALHVVDALLNQKKRRFLH
ncbi:MAG: response regulator [Myxococcales bacterium]|jgi:DNA-binding response OmpR family regulator|nr:response regulator [Myxococcales bacterium]